MTIAFGDIVFHFSFWILLIGAGAGVAATALSRGRNRLLKAAVIGAVAAFLIDLARGFL